MTTYRRSVQICMTRSGQRSGLLTKCQAPRLCLWRQHSQALGCKDKEAIQKPSTEGSIHGLSFSNDKLYLKTKRQFLELNCLLCSVGQPYLYIKQQWVACRTEDTLWFPPDYRSTCSAVLDNILVMGHTSGQVTFVVFGLTKIPLGAVPVQIFTSHRYIFSR